MPPHQVEKLIQARRKLGLARSDDEADFCEYCGVCHLDGEHIKPIAPPANGLDTDLVQIITARVMRELNR